MQHILVVDDEAAITSMVEQRLQRDGFAVVSVGTGAAALAAVHHRSFAAVLLDLGLPDMDGFDVLRRLRATHEHLPVIILTARGDEIDRVVGLELGADDYVVKPFSPRELVARVKAILRRLRPASAAAPELLSFKHLALEIDVERREVRRAGRAIELTPLEFQLLRVLAASPGRVFTREQLLQRVWGDDFYGTDRVVDVHIGLLRRKLEVAPGLPQPIQTVRGVGYRFSDG